MMVYKSLAGIAGQPAVIQKQNVVSQRSDLVTVMCREYDGDFF